MKRINKIITAFLIIGAVVCQCLVVGAVKPETKQNKANNYMTTYSEKAIVIDENNLIDKGNYNIDFDAVKMENGIVAEYAFSVPETAKYNALLWFGNINSSAEKYDLELRIDGNLPFEECSSITVKTVWEDDGEVRTLSNGDQVSAEQKQIDGFVTQSLSDELGINILPYEFLLTAGNHTVSVRSTDNDFLLKGIIFDIPQNVKTYKEVSAVYNDYPLYAGEQIVIEAEDTLYRNDFTLVAKGDVGSVNLSPHDPYHTLINHIGGSNWCEPNQEITWQVDIPENGLYKLGFSFKQNTIIDGYTYRSLKIDGKTPFAEADGIGFSYKTKWQFKNFANKDGEDYLIYLTEGTHLLSLSVTLSEISEIVERLNKAVESIGNTYLDIVMITGESPDANRDYELHKQIPEFIEFLETNSKELGELSADLQNKYNVNGELDGAVRNMVRVLEEMRGNLYSAHLYLDTYYSYYQTLCSWMYDIKNMSLSLDKIVLAAPEKDFETEYAGFFKSVMFSVKRFFASFINDYSMNTGDMSDKDSKTIKIWVNWGRDQVKVLNTLIQSYFIPKTGINVNVEQVNASLVQGVISNNSPDLYLHLARTEPVNLAMRGLLYDLKQFDDYDEVMKNFQKDSERPYLYKDGCYALPDTQAFYVMFYRKDILDELGIKVPQTWDEFLSATAILQRKNMNTYLPHVKIATDTTVNTGAGGLTIFPTMLMQNGGELYNETLNKTLFDSQTSLKSFKFWVDFYSKYKLNPDANFYQRFRVGTIPLGVAQYTTYQAISVTATEIKDKWEIAMIPGVKQADGSINRTCSGSGTGCSIMKSSKNKNEAWEFLKWWVSEDTQYGYSSNVEAVLGSSGRTATANVSALKRLSWDKESLNTILQQWENVQELYEVPGSYYVSRAVDQAFWAVYNKKDTPREAIRKWAEISNNEIERKISEYADK